MQSSEELTLPATHEFFRTVLGPTIDYSSPAQGGLERMTGLFECSPADLPHGEGWGEDTVTMNSHCGTHVDAPSHSGSTCEGRPARTITDITLDELYRPAMVLDVRSSARPGEAIEIAALEAALDAVGRPITDGDAVLIRTGQERFTTRDPEFFEYPGMTAAGTDFLTAAGATILGTDAMGWDRPFSVMKKAFQKEGDGSEIWDGHFAIQQREAFIVQQLTNLDQLPPTGFMVGFFPIRLSNASAAPARVVAFLD
nr:cyclase family protein [uncultured Rhodococcus sp.]